MGKDVAVLGDYNAEYVTHRAIDAAIGLFPSDVRVTWVPTDSHDASNTQEFDGLWIAPGTPYRGDDAVYSAITKARVDYQPLLATCGGFQYAVVEFARNVLDRHDAAHAETDPFSKDLVVVPLACSLVGERRVIEPIVGSKLAEICGTEPFSGFHWCNYGVADDVVRALERRGLRPNATAADAGVEGFELDGHPFFIATLFQPQVAALDDSVLDPLIIAFLESVQQLSNVR